MKASKLSLSIPEPCHENWNNMLPDEKGRFCLSCSKSVHDFTGKSDQEIHAILMANKDQKVCGRFSKSQLNRPLNIRVNLADLPSNMSATRSFAIALFLVFGSLLFSCTDSFGQNMGEVTVVLPVKTKELPEKNLPPDSLFLNTDPVTGDVKWEAPVMGKMEYIEAEQEPDSLETPPDSMQVIPRIEPSYMGGVRLVPLIGETQLEENQETETLLGDTILVKRQEEPELKTTEPDNDFRVYPNPGKEEFNFSYTLVRASDVILEIYGEKGELIDRLFEIPQQHAGIYTVPMKLPNLSPGIYFANLIVDGKRSTKKIVVSE